MELDLGAVRAFVTVVDTGHFGDAAELLGLSQQAVSKRVAKLEADLGTALLHRSSGGAAPAEDGMILLPHARALIGLADQAAESLRGRRARLRVDVLNTRLATIELVRAFHDTTDEVDIDIVTSNGLRSAHGSLMRGSVDAAFARVPGGTKDPIEHLPAYLEPAQLLVGRKHPLARRRKVRLAELSTRTAWMPGNTPGSEWSDFYEELEREHFVRIDTSGPDFGLDDILDRLARSAERFTFGGELMRVPWHPGVLRVPIVDPTPVYPFSLLWHRRNRHPLLPALISHIKSSYRPPPQDRVWLPSADRSVFYPHRDTGAVSRRPRGS